MENFDEILTEFALEAREILDQLDSDFVLLEASPTDKKLIGNIFRGLHTLKGSSGFFSFKRLEKISHAGESLLGKIRDGQLSLDIHKSNVLLQMIDVLRTIIEGIEKSKTEPAGEDALLISAIGNLARGNDQIVNDNASEPLVADVIQPMPDVVINSADLSDTEVSSNLTNTDNLNPPPTQEIQETQENNTPVRINLDTLDKLMNLASEMVLARNRLLPFADNSADLQFTNTVHSIDLLTLELQERMMKMRMQSISHVWSKFPRLIRDAANQTNKKVTLIQNGADTEIDRSLLDAIRDPLMHIIRNSVDHSIEEPDVRIRKGKPDTGQIILNASHQNGMILIEVSDDGAGINLELIKRRAIERKLISPEIAAQLSKSELIDLIFQPGFSTKEAVSNLSGRGVGMDVVKTNITNIGGTIDITSEPDMGTQIQLKIPLTLAIIPALFITCADQVFAIPENRIIELVKLSPTSQADEFQNFHGIPVFKLRNQLLPLIYLDKVLELKATTSTLDDDIYIVLLQSGSTYFGLAVASVDNIQDIVVKPLGGTLNDIPYFAGATIMGNGRVSLILDIDNIALHSGFSKQDLSTLNKEKQLDTNPPIEMMGILVFEIAGLERMAIPLDRLRHIDILDLEQSQMQGDKEVIYLNKELFYVIQLNQFVNGADTQHFSKSKHVPALTCVSNQRLYSLVVEHVVEIIQVPKQLIESAIPQKGIEGYAIWNDQVINILDLDEILLMYNMQDSDIYPKTIDIEG
jgi:two-component system, chemotaxis family, sensor kinase CheA